jgi:DeoR/GlpR family transcriptional regulator of sugar metabolism
MTLATAKSGNERKTHFLGLFNFRKRKYCGSIGSSFEVQPTRILMPANTERERESAVLKDLAAYGVVQVQELATKLGVSKVTVRKDLEALEGRQLLRRIRGGAIKVSSSDEGHFSYRLQRRATEKRAIARHVARVVNDGDTIAIDSSTTGYYLARALLDRKNLVVITNSLPSASLLMEESDAMVIMLGGVLRRSSASLVATFGPSLEGRGPITHGFFGAVSVSTQLGLMELDHGEAVTKRALAASCLNVYGLISSEKAAQFGLNSFAVPAQVTRIYTDENVSLEFAQTCSEAGMPIIAVPISQDLLSGDDVADLSGD